MIKQYANLAIAGAVLAGVVALGGYVWHLKAVANRAEGRSESAAARAAEHAIAATAWETAGLQAQLDLAKCQAQWTEATDKAQDMLAEANARRIQAEAEAQTWRKRWDARPQGCSAALAALDTACPAIEGY